MAELGKDYIINEYGEVVSGDEDKSDKLSDEYHQLDYEIFSHPDRFTPDELAAKKARYEELAKILGITKKSNALAAGRDALKKRMAAMRNNGQSYSETLAQNIAAQKDRD